VALEDADLVARVLAVDDRRAFAELVRRHQAATRSFLRRLCGGDEGRADDLAQEVFLLAYRGLAEFRGAAKLSTWLHRIAYNRFLADLRSRKLERPEPRQPPEIEPASGGAHGALLRHDVERALAYLRPEERAALALCAVSGMSHSEAAEVLGCPVGTVKTHVLRGKEKLRDRLRSWQEEATR
jgi:RNA polymerase sigma-70 factor (ECF subfamily)